MEDLNSHLQEDDVIAAVRVQHGPNATLLSYRTERATSSVQGFLSLMLRVYTKIEKNGEVFETRMIAKTIPDTGAQLNFIKEYNVFDREIAYYKEAVPILQENASGRLPLVTCYLARNDTLYMEDLNASGFETFGETMQDLANEDLLQLQHVVLVFRKYAQLHAASLDTDWYAVLPEFLSTDALFIKGAFQDILARSCASIATLMKELFPTKDCSKYEKWLIGDNCFNTMKQLAKPMTGALNVLNHGDSWLYNMMVKFKPGTRTATDLKFVDLQIYRFTSPARDLLYFLYACTTRTFRNKHLEQILRSYVEAFNAAACRTPDLLTYEGLRKDYESARMFGMGMAICMRQLIHSKDKLPEAGEHLSNAGFETMMQGDHCQSATKQFNEDVAYRKAMTDIVEEVMELIDLI